MLMQQLGYTAAPARNRRGLSSRLFSWLAAAPIPPSLKPLSFGLVTTLLPCGWLYTFADHGGCNRLVVAGDPGDGSLLARHATRTRHTRRNHPQG